MFITVLLKSRQGLSDETGSWQRVKWSNQHRFSPHWVRLEQRSDTSARDLIGHRLQSDAVGPWIPEVIIKRGWNFLNFFFFLLFFPSSLILIMLRTTLTTTFNQSTRLLQKPLTLSGARFYHEKVMKKKDPSSLSHTCRSNVGDWSLRKTSKCRLFP